LTLLLSTTGCLVPLYFYLPGAELERTGEVRMADDVRVTVGPRALLQKISRRVERELPAVTVVDPIAFRDAAFPDGGWRLDDLMASERCGRLSQELDVRLLVLVGAGAYAYRDEAGFVLPGLAAVTVRDAAVLGAAVFDLGRGGNVCGLRARSQGRNLFLNFYVFMGVGSSMTTYSVERGLAEAIVAVLRENTGGEPTRVAILAAEASGDPFVAYEGAPIVLGRDVEVIAMIERLANVEADFATRGMTRAELRRRLGDPLTTHSGLRLELYRSVAVAENRVRRLWVWMDPFRKDPKERPYAGYLLVAYGEGERVSRMERVMIAADVGASETDGMGGLFVAGARSEWVYDFELEPRGSAALDGVRLEVDFVDGVALERLYSMPDETLLFEDGRWSTEQK
jgi:hypothetical protein